ncbi:hypothetical protein AB0J86_22630 [Micromonospora sp. NPDC049559]|uniref:hypothetical protein n=1 Tax=Micromonospora sp. NPDC049559 TaxID=3155923 RepID=UPI00341CB3BC
MTISGPPGPPSPYPAFPGQHGEAGGQVGAGGPPPPPPGPGVAPPFAAPPTEGRSLRLWLGLGAGALAVLLCCGGGGAALVGLVIAGSQAVNEQARAVTGDYFSALRTKNYNKAYGLLCEDQQVRESPSEFERRISAEPEIASYRVQDARVGAEVVVPVDVTFTGGGQELEEVTLVQDGRTGTLEVCGVG